MVNVNYLRRKDMNDIELIKAEIERMHQEAVLAACGNDTDWLRSRIATCVDILAFIDSLPDEASYDTQNYAPTPSVSIDDVARVQFASHAHVFDRKRKAVFDWEQFKEVAGIFYGFGKRDSLPDETCKDSLQVLETCKEDTDSFASLEEAANDSWVLYEYRETPQGLYSSCYLDGFIAGAKWQANQLLKGSPLPEDTVLFQKGVEEGKRLMMEDAVEGEIGYWNQRGLSIRFDKSLEKLGYDMDTKVKIIIIKDND